MADGFLGRWSQRKIAIKEGKPLDEVVPVAKPAVKPDVKPAVAPADQSPAADSKASTPSGVWGQPNFQAYGAPAPQAAAPADEVPAQEPPTLADAQTLTPQSDFKPYMSAQVSPDVRNAAMKKLFADPHFNVMDGLDIYIDDYTKPDPLPLSMMRQMASANFLGLFDDEKKEQASPTQAPSSELAAPSPQSLPAEESPVLSTPQTTAAQTAEPVPRPDDAKL